jgi:large subunit ribosomal protein L24
MHVKKGDKVRVITGKDKGKVGVIVRALPQDERVVIEGVAVAKRHVKGRSGQTGRIVERPMPVHVSNVQKVAS